MFDTRIEIAGGVEVLTASGPPVVVRCSDESDGLEQELGALLKQWWQQSRPAWVAPDWYDLPLRAEVRALIHRAPGPELVAALAAVPAGVCTYDHAGEQLPGWPVPGHVPGWPCACQVVLAAAWEACAAWVAAGSARAMVGAAGATEVRLRSERASAEVICDPAREELAHALRLAPTTTAGRIAAARELAAHPGLLRLVETAAITAWAARCVILEVSGLTAESARQVVEALVGRVQERLTSGRRAWTPPEVRREARTLRLRLAPDQQEDVRRRAWADRKVQVFPDRDGMAVLHANLAEEQALRIHRRLSALARGLDDPERTMDQVRADILVDVLLAAGQPAGQPPTEGAAALRAQRGGPEASDAVPAEVPTDASADGPDDGPTAVTAQRPAPAPARPGAADGPPGLTVRPEVCVVVGLGTLLRLDDEPAHIPGLGPIPAEVARELAADGGWRAWVTDAASGVLMATGSRRYTPGAALARLVRGREPECRMPGCRRRAESCDIDHCVPWPRGSTCAANLGPLCRRHHQFKTQSAWRLEGKPEAWRWRTPAGFTIHDGADPPLR